MAQYDDNHVYAETVTGRIIYIEDAESGKRGYFCLGCKREMQAVKVRVQSRASYFRHDPQAVKGQPKCTYSDEEHRHQLAKEILAKNKRIRLPAVYKFPPAGEDGPAMLLEEPRILEAHSIRLETYVYENEAGELCFGSKQEMGDRPLLVKPDVIFFNAQQKPILCVELVATHKTSNEKKIKLKRLGIDTIQIHIPKDSPEAIEDCFSNLRTTKWIFNNVEENTQYLRISDSFTAGVPPIDEQQRELFEESFTCRRAQINNLIRAISRCLESKPYQDAENGFRTEISHVEKNTADTRRRINEFREDCRARVVEKLSGEISEVEMEEDEFTNGERAFWEEFEDLEKRYLKKRESLELEEAEIDRIRGAKTAGSQIAGDSIAIRRKEIEGRYRANAERIESEQGQINRSLKSTHDEIAGFDREMEAFPSRFERLRKEIVRRFEQRTKDENREIKAVETETSGLQREFESNREKLEEHYEGARKQADQRVTSRNIEGNTDLSRRIKELVGIRKLIDDIEKASHEYKRKRIALDCIKSGAYENWI